MAAIRHAGVREVRDVERVVGFSGDAGRTSTTPLAASSVPTVTFTPEFRRSGRLVE
jgi:hypothetical protein